jgi:hypothetical protein
MGIRSIVYCEMRNNPTLEIRGTVLAKRSIASAGGPRCSPDFLTQITQIFRRFTQIIFCGFVSA